MTLGLLQNSFLNGVCTQCALVSVYLVSGIKLQGYITAFDQHTVLLKNTSEQIIFKHAIATVVAHTDVAWQLNRDEVIEEGCLDEG